MAIAIRAELASTYSAAPAGFPGSSSSPVGSLIVTLAGGNSTWLSLTAGNAQQLVALYNAGHTTSAPMPRAAAPGSQRPQLSWDGF